jgi:hypothetical protein
MTQSEPRVPRPLAELVPLIRADIAAGEIAKGSYYAATGELLWEAENSLAQTGLDSHWFMRWATETFDCTEVMIKFWMSHRPWQFIPIPELDNADGTARLALVTRKTDWFLEYSYGAWRLAPVTDRVMISIAWVEWVKDNLTTARTGTFKFGTTAEVVATQKNLAALHAANFAPAAMERLKAEALAFYQREQAPEAKATEATDSTAPKRPPRPAPKWHNPAQGPVQAFKNQINFPRLAEEQEAREKEAKLRRRIELQLIDAGYKAVATKLHPDKGGSKEDMTRLNQARALLKGMFK